ncbi:MAG: hypothetical protein A3I79_04785, partial [Gemmatimonadetes bacterium RIFCSPLOWO2_02_FULL_71_11]
MAPPSEFETLLEPVLDGAYGLALRLTRNRADAEDLVQEAALLAFRGFRTFVRGTNFRAWFLRILSNAFISSLRKQRPETGAVSLEEIPSAYMQRQAHQLAASGAAGAVAPGDLVLTVTGKLESDQITAAIDALPEEYRLVCTLYFLQDLPYREIADVLEIP